MRCSETDTRLPTRANERIEIELPKFPESKAERALMNAEPTTDM